MEMFCYQCEQRGGEHACTKFGVCGKSPETAGLQDLIIYQLEGIGTLADKLRQNGKNYEKVDKFVTQALFITVTNVNFDNKELAKWVQEAESVKDFLKNEYAQAGGETLNCAQVDFKPADTVEGMLEQAQVARLDSQRLSADPEVRAMKHLLLYGLKGLAAYADHAMVLNQEDDEIFAFMQKALAGLADLELSAQEGTGLAMECGKINIRCMEILNIGHTTRFGHPEPAAVSTTLQPGPAIVVSGHDLYDLEQLLIQTKDKGVNIYTHGEMLPAHGYPGLKKYKHLAGHFGTAWQNQQNEFDGVPVAFLFTTNCIQKPKASYIDNVFTCGLVGWPDVTHIADRNFAPVIDKAIALGGVKEAVAGHVLNTGFGHNAVLSVADKVIDAVKSGAIKHFFLVGGCDGAKMGRNYYTDFVKALPEDTMVLTLACGKFRFNHLNLGAIGDIPRLLDIGQCNDAYSAVRIAQALAEAFNCGINELPLSFILSWYEQKAVVILLSLLYLGVKGMRLGPTLPSFITPAVLDFLVKEFDIKPIGDAQKDIADILG